MLSSGRIAVLMGLFLVALSAGCASTGGGRRSISTPYDRTEKQTSRPTYSKPEVYIVGATRKQSFEALVNRLTGSTWRVASANDYQVTLEAREERLFMQFLLGIGSVYRLIAYGKEDGGGTILGATLSAVSQPGTNREMVIDLKGPRWDPLIQMVLDGAREEAAKPQSAK